MRPSSNQLYSGAASRLADEQTIQSFGIDGFTLMEIAATRGADYILNQFPTHRKLLVIAGKGNNAGDALAISRIITAHGYATDIFFVLGDENLSSDTQRNLSLIKKLQELSPETAPRLVKELHPQKYNLILDGLFGTGLQNDIKGHPAEIIKQINQSGIPIISMDIPSGLHADSGKIMGVAVYAKVTLLFGTRKLGCYLGDGPLISGERILCELPFPEKYLEQEYPVRLLNVTTEIQSPVLLKPRHKYEAGVAYVIGGSPGLTGAAILAAKAAWSTGCGAVTVCTPRGLSPAYDAHLVEQTRLLCGSNSDKEFKPSHAEFLLDEISKRPGVVVIGPGLGRSNDTISFVETFLKQYSGNIIIDADALHALSLIGAHSIHPNANVILTPHPGELKKLHDIEHPSPKTLKFLIRTYPNPEKTTLLSKGFPSIVSNHKMCYITEYDTRIFGRAGFGDVLAGKISGFLSKRYSSESAACLALIEGWEKAKTIKSEIELSPLKIL